MKRFALRVGLVMPRFAPFRSGTELPLIGKAHADPHSWRRSAGRYADSLHRNESECCSECSTAADRPWSTSVPGVFA